jgi:hypothetical protein
MQSWVTRGAFVFIFAEDPAKLLVNGKSGETVDLTCGRQKPVK